MATTYPTTKQSIPNPTATDLLENADATLDHDFQHGTANDTIEALQDKVGIDGSAVTTSHDYKLSGVTGSDKAASKTGTETLENKTLTSPQVNFGSDATGDMIYRGSDGVTKRLPAGADGTIISYSGGVPTVVANPAASDASETVKGVVEKATAAEINAGTAAGATGAQLFIGPDQLALSDYPTTTEVETIVTANATSKFGSGTTQVDTRSTTTEQTLMTQAIAGGTLGTANGIRFEIPLSSFQIVATQSITIRLKYGATTIATATLNGASAGNTNVLQGSIRGLLLAAGTTSSQKGMVQINVGDGTFTTASFDHKYFMNDAAYGTATEDSTGALNLVVTAQNSASSANDGLISEFYIVEKIA